MLTKQDHQKTTGAEAFFGAGLIILGISGVLFLDVIKDYQNRIEMKDLQVEPEAGYYKVHLIREEKALNFLEEGSLTAVIEDSNGNISVINIPKTKPIGWDLDNTVLKVYIRDDVKMYWFMDSME